jgi:hypothetical protein
MAKKNSFILIWAKSIAIYTPDGTRFKTTKDEDDNNNDDDDDDDDDNNNNNNNI